LRRYQTIAQILHGHFRWTGERAFGLNALVHELDLKISLLPISELRANGAIAPRLRVIGLALELDYRWMRWVLAHEIGHLFSPCEEAADAFAAELLIPEHLRCGENLADRFRVPATIVESLNAGLPCVHTKELIAA